MARTEVTISASPPGAGRFKDYIWPDPCTYTDSTNATSRIAGYKANISGLSFANIGFGGGTPTRVNVRHGLPCIDLPCTAVAGNGNGRGAPSAKLMFPTLKTGNFSSPLFDDMRCWRIIFIGGMVTAPNVEQDIGFACINTGNVGDCVQLVVHGRDGFAFGFVNNGSVRFFSNVGGVQTQQIITPTAAQGYAIDAMHMYEMRIEGATPTTDATMKVFLDGAQVALPATLASWAPGTKLPVMVSPDAASAGFVGGFGCISGGGVNTLFVHQFRVICGPTLQSLL